MTRQTQILVKRDPIDTYKNFDFIPKEYELVTAYDVKTKKIIYKLGDGVTPWKKLKKITKLSQLDKFAVYPKNCPGAMIFALARLAPSLGSVPAAISSIKIKVSSSALSRISLIFFICEEKVDKLWIIFWSSPISAYIFSNGQIFASAQGKNIPDLAININNPTVFNATVFPPVFEPVIIIDL